ncbi:MAG: bifunctional sulfate adenylyltransferase/adenylylsulfate kinase [Candidatus Paceibacterota bacterium]
MSKSSSRNTKRNTKATAGRTYPAHGGDLKDLLYAGDSDDLRERIAGAVRIILTPRQLCDLELLLVGGFSPLEGFMDEVTYRSVVDTMRLPGGAVWPMPIVLDQDRVHVAEGDEVVLCDSYNKPLALLQVTSIYKPDKTAEAEGVYGTTDKSHFGVRYLFEKTGSTYIGGPVTGISLPEYFDFTEYRLTPRQLRDRFSERGVSRVVGFQTRNPLHRAHHDLIRRAARDHGALALVHPSVGVTKDGDIDHVTRVKAYKVLHENYLSDIAELSLLPLAMRMGGPREALWHAIIRKNYGCTHFIIGRDHAGPGKNEAGEPFYGDYDAHELVAQYADELGIEVVPMKKVVYVEEKDEFIPEDEVSPNQSIKELSGTEVRRRLLENEDIPEWFSFPEVVSILRKSTRKNNQENGQVGTTRGAVIFFTGLSGSGKTTVARTLAAYILERYNREVTLLDGDVVRENLSKGLTFSKEDRDTNVERIGFVAGEVAKHGGLAICSAIAPYIAAREANRRRVSANGEYIEVYVSTPLETCEARDVKGLYAGARAGNIKNFTGISDPYEEPIDPEIKLDTSAQTPQECVATIVAYLESRALLTE